MFTVPSYALGGRREAPARPTRRRPWGRVALALVILNEVRGLIVVAIMVRVWLGHH